MMPVVFRIPFIEKDIPGYGLMLMIAFLAAILWAARRASRSGANPDVILNCGFVALVAGVVGARLMYVIHYWDQFANRGGPLQIAWAVVDVTKGGLEHYGGVILSVICVSLWLIFKEKVSWRWYMDIIAPSAALGLAFGRLGCFLNGCCHGAETNLPWAVQFPYASPAFVEHFEHKHPGMNIPPELLVVRPGAQPRLIQPDDLRELQKHEKLQSQLAAGVEERTRRIAAERDPTRKAALEREKRRFERDLADLSALKAHVEKYQLTPERVAALAATCRAPGVHPAQIYSTVTALLIALILNALYWRRTRDGQVICALFLIEPSARWLIELIRTDNPQDAFGFTISQFLAICMTLAALACLLWLRRLPPRSPRAVRWEPPVEAKPAQTAAG